MMNISRFGSREEGDKVKLYRQIVLPKLEYCSSVWDPYHIGLQRALEKVQKRVILGKWDINYGQTLNELKLPSLHNLRLRQRLLCCFEIINGHINIPFDNYWSFKNNRSLRTSHSLELRCKFARTDVCKYSFFIIQLLTGINYLVQYLRILLIFLRNCYKII